ncbi:MAG: SEFIR domain-containing protein [Nitrososphaera sp.]
MVTDKDTNQGVFISYTHDSEKHKHNVLTLANALIYDGMRCEIDRYHEHKPPGEGWPAWTHTQVRKSAFVLVVCTKRHKRVIDGDEDDGKKLGSKWELSAITQQIYSNNARNTRFIPIIFGSSNKKYIPDILSSTSHYDVFSERGYDSLCRHITDQPRTSKPALGRKRQRPHLEISARAMATIAGYQGVSHYLRQVVCFNQGELPQYSLLVRSSLCLDWFTRPVE